MASIAPNPDRDPSMTVPTTVRRETVVDIRLEDGNADGSGIYDSNNRNNKTGIAFTNIRRLDGRCHACMPAINIVG